MNNDIIIISNCIINRLYNSQKCSELYDKDKLKSFEYHKAKLYRGSLIFTSYIDAEKIAFEYEVIESDPPMKPEELLKIWRLLYE